jgi:hypothetical protein
MIIKHSPCPGGQGSWRKLAIYRPATSTLKDKAIVPDGDVFACAAEYDVARISTLPGRSA